MLMDLWKFMNDRRFAGSVMPIARNPQQGFGSWSDGETLIDLFCSLRDRDYCQPFIYESELLGLLEKALMDSIRWGSCDMLSTFVDSVDAANGLPPSIISALHAAVLEDFEQNTSRIREDDIESSLSDRIDALEKLGSRFVVSDSVLDSAVSAIENCIGELKSEVVAPPLRVFHLRISVIERRLMTELFETFSSLSLIAGKTWRTVRSPSFRCAGQL
ncbi:hypothetical protein [Stenotrophomonas rhizophila]|uniref:hypothetical protein n=1 Tax=Stenotrophomonas rhizophila TaxID=216778 RepID=UPI000F4CBC77|nr:hypothetical protein [Stenotrophomonas rhizophila]